MSIISIKLKDGATFSTLLEYGCYNYSAILNTPTIFNKCLLSDTIGGRTANKITRWFLELSHRNLYGLQEFLSLSV